MGFEGHESLIQHCRPAYFQLKRDILLTRPQFSALESHTGTNSNLDDIIAQEEDESVEKATRDPMYVDEVAEMIKKWVEYIICPKFY